MKYKITFLLYLLVKCHTVVHFVSVIDFSKCIVSVAEVMDHIYEKKVIMQCIN